MEAASQHGDPSLHEARLIVDCAWEELQRSPYVQARLGVAQTRLPDVSFAEAERRSNAGNLILKRLQALDLGTLPHELALTLRLVVFQARAWSRAAQWYWIAIDPLGIGEFGLFLPTAYCGGYLLSYVHKQLASFAFSELRDADRYLALVVDYACLIDQFTARTTGQAERGIRIPRVQAMQARSLLTALKSGVRAQLAAAPQHAAAWPQDFAGQVENCIATCVEPAFDRALAGLSDAYFEQAPEMVGIGQYAGGEAVYAELVKLHTTLDLTPEQVQVRGLERMSEIEESISAIQAELGFKGDSKAFVACLNNDPQWRANTVEGVKAVFQRYIDRLRPHLKEYFSIAPKAAYGVAPLPEALQEAMTYGYYDPPRSDRAEGLYLFNASHLTKQSLFHLGALTYHELMPGHHLQLATQQENPDLHPFRAHSFVTAYIEGWAEYAATLAGEMGLYEMPQERYGRLVMDAFLTSRLVVDTGMNVLGWSLERAREYMRTHSRLTEAEILTESVRYSCDIPAQALAYKVGDAQILAMRDRMRCALGERFNLKDFHDAILRSGALPLADLDWHVDRKIEQRVHGVQTL